LQLLTVDRDVDRIVGVLNVDDAGGNQTGDQQARENQSSHDSSP
jgi:hypothetical protein